VTQLKLSRPSPLRLGGAASGTRGSAKSGWCPSRSYLPPTLVVMTYNEAESVAKQRAFDAESWQWMFVNSIA